MSTSAVYFTEIVSDELTLSANLGSNQRAILSAAPYGSVYKNSDNTRMYYEPANKYINSGSTYENYLNTGFANISAFGDVTLEEINSGSTSKSVVLYHNSIPFANTECGNIVGKSKIEGGGLTVNYTKIISKIADPSSSNYKGKIEFQVANNSNLETMQTITTSGVFVTSAVYAEGTKRVACGGGTTGVYTSAAGYVTLEISGTSYKLLYMT